MKRSLGIVTAVLALAAVLGAWLPSFAAEGRKTVRVGHFSAADYQERDASGRMVGYSNEYLQRVARIAGWDLEYVHLSLAEALDQLRRGQVDVVGFLSKTPEREAELAYPALYSGITSGMLVTLPNNLMLQPQNPASLNGARIGMVRESLLGADFMEFARQNTLSIVPVYYHSEDALQEALNNGEVDAATLSGSKVRVSRRVLLEYGFKPFYFVTSRNNTALLAELNAAVAEIETRYGNFVRKINAKYFPPWNHSEVLFTDEELAYLRTARPLRVMHDTSWYPIESIDPKTGKLLGVGKDVLDIISRKSGLVFEPASFPRAEAGIAAFLDGQVDVVMGYSDNAAFVQGHLASEPYLSMPVAFIGSKSGQFDPANITVALPRYYSGIPRIVREERSNYRQIFYPTPEDCVDAVRRGEVSLTAENIYVAQHSVLSKHPGLAIIDTTTLSFTPQLIFQYGTSPLLVSIIDKCIASIQPRDIENLFFKYAALTYQREAEENMRRDTWIWGSGVLLALGCVLLFIRHLVRSNRKVREALTQAERASRAKTDFFKNLSHELRTPINAIMGLAETGMQAVNAPDKVLGKLQKITISTEHLLSLINDILDMSKIEAGKVTLDPVPEAFRQKVQFLCELFASRCALKFQALHMSYDERIAPCLMNDKKKLDQILINVLGNAVKFTPDHGEIFFETRLVAKEATRERVAFVIRDTGPGMDESTLQTLFVPFERASKGSASKVEGSGLGMAIVSKLAERMDAEVEIDSHVGQGTAITISLWCDVADPERLQADAPSSLAETSGASLAGRRVLLAEDVEINREIVVELLTAEGVEVECAVNGREAVDMFTASAPGHYDLVFMDVLMPVMGGYEATAAIRGSSHPDAAQIPIVALTANAFVEDRADAMAAGMNAHVAKPFKVEELYNAIRQFACKA